MLWKIIRTNSREFLLYFTYETVELVDKKVIRKVLSLSHVEVLKVDVTYIDPDQSAFLSNSLVYSSLPWFWK